MKFAPASVRFMGTQSPAASPDVVIPELHDTLEWVLSSPPSVHQFEEPPVSWSTMCLQCIWDGCANNPVCVLVLFCFFFVDYC